MEGPQLSGESKMKIGTFKELIGKKDYRFFDFGCSEGGCIDYAYKTFDDAIPGLGFDNNEAKIKLAKDNGHDAIAIDIMKIPDCKLVNFVTMSHFLEHLPSLEVADQYLRKAVTVSKQFVFIRQPYFDADGYLAQQGLKLYWSDWWGGHSNKMTSLDFYLSLNKMRIEGLLCGFRICFADKISNISHNAIHPLNSPGNQHSYQDSIHPSKGKNAVLENVFREIFVLIHINKVDGNRFRKIDVDKNVISV